MACAYRVQQRSAHYPDPGPLTITVGDTGWLANGRITPIRRSRAVRCKRYDWRPYHPICATHVVRTHVALVAPNGGDERLARKLISYVT